MVAFVYKRRTALQFHLHLLDIEISNDAYESVLATLGTGIRMAAERIEDARDEDGIIDYETEIIENMLGVSYVVCQIQITAVVQAALNVPSHSLNAHNVRGCGPRFNDDYSKIEVLWALASYFKHRDEWTRKTWTRLSGPARPTVAVIKAAGLKFGSTGNLRTGAVALGNDSYTNVALFEEIIRSWSADVRKHVATPTPRPAFTSERPE
jgi:hypothetical protein